MSDQTSAQVLFQDEDLLAVDKPAGIAVIPGRGEAPETSLKSVLERRLGRRLWVVHRLDRDVSGVWLVAKSAEAHRRMSLAFEKGEVKKRYWALVRGRVAEESGRIELPLRTGGHGGKTVVDVRRGKPSLTAWRVRERRHEHTVLEVEPHTGRTHQLRVHLKAIGHPLLMDPKYGERVAGGARPARASLHAERLQVKGERGVITIEAPLPEDLRNLLLELR